MTTGEVTTLIEIPRGSNQKYEWDRETGLFVLDRVLGEGLYYPYAYGLIKNTLGGDGDEIDTLLVSAHAFQTGDEVECMILGVLLMEDEKGPDEKLLVVPRDAVENDLSDLSNECLDEIREFFINYKKPDFPTKWSRVHGFGDRARALELYHESVRRFLTTTVVACGNS
jgi:inorganic pyrophosphatase